MCRLKQNPLLPTGMTSSVQEVNREGLASEAFFKSEQIVFLGYFDAETYFFGNKNEEFSG